jgi:hypothetical protein
VKVNRPRRTSEDNADRTLAAHSWNGGSDLSDKYALISTILKALKFPMVELISESVISDLNGRVGLPR